MFDTLSELPADPLLKLINLFAQDHHPNKIDLGVGVYKDHCGQTPVLDVIKQAERHILESESSKAYVGALGNEKFSAALARLVLGEGSEVIADKRLAMVQTPGGCGALRLAAELVMRAKPGATVWLSDPTWANHQPLLGNAGLDLKYYPYYDFVQNKLRFDEMMSCLALLGPQDLVLLHASCHNPSGADLSQAQWQQLADLAAQRGFVPVIDVAYQGLGDGLNEDAYGLRLLASRLDECILAISCSKNFGLYRERVGAIGVISRNRAQREVAQSHLINIARGIYSMPPSHGSKVVEYILSMPELTTAWHQELDEMRRRITFIRAALVRNFYDISPEVDFEHIRSGKGMFSFLGLSETQVAELIADHSIYMASTSRINLSGLNDTNIDYFYTALRQVLSL